MAVPVVRIVVEGLTHEATVSDAALGIEDQKVGMRLFVHPDATTRPAGTLGFVEHEELGHDVAIYEAVTLAAEGLVEGGNGLFGGTADDLDGHQAVTHKKSCGQRRL